MFIDFRERGKGREKERNINWLPLAPALTRDQTQNVDTCPDRESSLHSFGEQDDAPAPEPH